MKTFLTFAGLLLALCSFAQSKTEAQIKALSQKRVQFLLENKLDSLAAIYDEGSMTVHSNGLIKTTAEHLQDVKNGMPTYKSIELKSATVKDFGKTAVLVGQGAFKIAMNGNETLYNLVFTEVYIKRKTGWKLIARHSSNMN